MNQEIELIKSVEDKISKRNSETLDLLVESLYTTGKMPISKIMKIWDGEIKVRSLSQQDLHWIFEVLNGCTDLYPTKPIKLNRTFKLAQCNQYCAILPIKKVVDMKKSGYFNLKFEYNLEKHTNYKKIAELMLTNKYYHNVIKILVNLNKDFAEWSYNHRSHTFFISKGKLDVISGASIINAATSAYNKNLNYSFDVSISTFNKDELHQILYENFREE